MPTVLLSYSRDELKWRDLVRDAILRAGASWRVDVFVDESLPAGNKWETTIHKAVKDADVFVALVSAAWRASPWCPRELEWAHEKEKPNITWIAIDKTDEATLPHL